MLQISCYRCHALAWSRLSITKALTQDDIVMHKHAKHLGLRAHLGEECVQAVDLLLLLHKGIVLHSMERSVSAEHHLWKDKSSAMSLSSISRSIAAQR